MHNEGGRPFLFPGKVPEFEDVFPDVDRINPDYFRVLDAKIDYLNAQGFVPFIEVGRRDTGQAWKRFHDLAESYARFVNYVFARYHANITLLSPIHYDYYAQTITAEEYNEPIALALEQHGRPPFGTLLSANPNPSTLVNFGDRSSWIDLHQSGNVREHDTYWYLTEIFEPERKPAINGEPYYAGLHQLGTPYPLRVRARQRDRPVLCPLRALRQLPLRWAWPGSSMAPRASGTPDTSPRRSTQCGMSFRWRSADQIRHLRTFAEVHGLRYRELEPEAELLVPNKTGPGHRLFRLGLLRRDPGPCAASCSTSR